MITYLLIGFAILFLVDVFTYHKRHYEFTLVSFFLGIIVILYFTKGWTHVTPAEAGYVLGGYVVVGIVVASLKWFLFNVKTANWLKSQRSQYDRQFNEFKKKSHEIYDGGNKTTQLSRRQDFLAFLKGTHVEYLSKDASKLHSTDLLKVETDEQVVDILTHRVSDHADNITMWIAIWPIVIVDLILADIFIAIGDFLVNVLNVALRGFNKMMVRRGVGSFE